MAANDSAFVFPLSTITNCLYSFDHGMLDLTLKYSFPLLLPCFLLSNRDRRRCYQPLRLGSDWLLYAKLLCTGALAYTQLMSTSASNSALHQTLPTINSPLISVSCLVAVVLIEHQCTLRSSASLAIWLTLSFVSDLQQLSPHLSGHPLSYSPLHFLLDSLVLKFVLIVLQELPKQHAASPASQRSPARAANANCSAGFWTRSFLLCLNPTLPSLYGDLESVPLSSHYLEEILSNQEPPGDDYASAWLFSTVCAPLGGLILALLSSRIVLAVCRLSQVTLLIKLLRFMDGGDYSTRTSLALVTAAFVVYFGIAFSRCLFKGLGDTFTVLIRGTLVPTVQRRLFTATDARQQELDPENIIDSHIESFADGIASVADSVAILIEMVVSIGWLMQLVGISTILLVGIPAAYLVIVKYYREGLPESRRALESIATTRLKKTSSLIAQIKTIRLASVDGLFVGAVERLRLAEVGKLEEIFNCKQALAIISVFLWTFPGPFVFGILCWAPKGYVLNASVIYPALGLIAIFVTATMDAVRAIDTAKTMFKCATSIQGFLCKTSTRLGEAEEGTEPSDEPIPTAMVSKRVPIGNVKDSAAFQPKKRIVQAVNACLGGDVSSTSPLLHNITLHIYQYEVAMVAGPTGCGKSTFLKSLLEQTTLLSGELRSNIDLVGYCSQEPWLQHVSIRENIIGYADFDLRWYKSVTHACLLQEDFSQLPCSDLSVVGNNGLTLSRGQRCRIALARALYLRSPCLLLDYTFSSLDAQTCQQVFSRIFGRNGICRRRPTTAIISTKSKELLRSADRVILIDTDGLVTMHTDQGAAFRRRLRSLNITDNDNETADDSDVDINFVQSTINPFEISAMKHETNYKDTCRLYLSFWDRKSIRRQIAYTSAAVACMVLTDAFACLGLSASLPGWLFLALYGAISGLSCLFMAIFVRMWYQQFAPLSARKMHQQLLSTIVRANLSFITQFSHSSILNLFDQELTVVSEVLPVYLLRVTYHGGSLFVQLCLIASLARYSFVFLAIYNAGICITLFWYLRVSRFTKIADASSKAAIHANLAEMTAGLRHPKAFGWQEQAMARANKVLADSQDQLYYSRSINRWMFLAIEISRSLASIALILLITVYQLPVPLLAIGLMLVLPMKAEDSTSIMIDDCAILQHSLQTLSALLRFSKEAPLESKGSSTGCILQKQWPFQGRVMFNSVTAKHNERCPGPPALQNANFTIPAGYNIGVTGQSRSGKSSVMMAILNFLDYKGVIKIDGVDLSRLSHRQLRQHITTISPEPLYMGGTVRDNLFPRIGGVEDDDNDSINPDMTSIILNSLGLGGVIDPWAGMERELSSLKLSNGQQRLVSVARSVLRNFSRGNNLVIMDDITGHLDPKTESTVVNAMMDAFSGKTVILEATTRELLAHCDFIAHMVTGRVVSMRWNPNGPAATKAEMEKTRNLVQAHRTAKNHQASGSTTNSSTMQASASGPAPIHPHYQTMLNVINGVPGARLEAPHEREIVQMRGALVATQAAQTANTRLAKSLGEDSE